MIIVNKDGTVFKNSFIPIREGFPRFFWCSSHNCNPIHGPDTYDHTDHRHIHSIEFLNNKLFVLSYGPSGESMWGAERKCGAKEAHFWLQSENSLPGKGLLPGITYSFNCRCQFEKVFIDMKDEWKRAWKMHTHFMTTDKYGLIQTCGIAKLVRNDETGVYTKEIYWEVPYTDLFSLGVNFVRDLYTRSPKVRDDCE